MGGWDSNLVAKILRYEIPCEKGVEPCPLPETCSIPFVAGQRGV
jgi:hypothetical protein